MSIESAREFVKRFKDNEEVRRQTSESHKKPIVDVGKDHGYEFNREEVLQALHEHGLQPEDPDDPDTCCLLV